MTREIWDEVIVEFPRMWAMQDYSHEGRWFSMPERNVLPKPWKKPHPPLWLSASNPPTYEKAARMGLGCLGFFLGGLDSVAPSVEAYKSGIVNAEPVGAYVNDNVCLIGSGACLEDGLRARAAILDSHDEYRDSLMRLYHDTIPRAPGTAVYPDVGPGMSAGDLETAILDGSKICGDPDEVIAQLKRYEAIGVDQFGFSAWSSVPHELRWKWYARWVGTLSLL